MTSTETILAFRRHQQLALARELVLVPELVRVQVLALAQEPVLGLARAQVPELALELAQALRRE